MKKLTASICCGLALHSFSHFTYDVNGNEAPAGSRVLLRAISIIVNAEANRKQPIKFIHIPAVESPEG